MIRLAAILFISTLAIPAIAQTAKVIELSPEESAEAKSLATEQTALTKKIDDLQQKIRRKYISDKHESLNHTYINCIVTDNVYSCPGDDPSDAGWILKPAWSNGYDYRFIVPKPMPVASPAAPCVGWQCGITIPYNGPTFYSNPLVECPFCLGNQFPLSNSTNLINWGPLTSPMGCTELGTHDNSILSCPDREPLH